MRRVLAIGMSGGMMVLMVKIGNVSRAGGVVMLALVLAVLGPACSFKKTAPPAWIVDGPADADSEWFYGVGCAQPEITNLWFKRRTARERARVDLAERLHDYLIAELGGDPAAARAVLVTVLPELEAADEYADEHGRLCALARLSRARVESELAARRVPGPPDSR